MLVMMMMLIIAMLIVMMTILGYYDPFGDLGVGDGGVGNTTGMACLFVCLFVA